MQIDPTAQQGTVDALVQQRFDLTAQPPTQQSQAGIDDAMTATASMNSLVDTAFLQALAATVNAPGTAIAATVRAETSLNLGRFNAYFLTVTDGTGAQMTTVRQVLTQNYHWNIVDLPLAQLTTPLYDAKADGQVLVIPGGSVPLSDAQLKAVEDFVNAGGSLIILAGTNLNTGKTSLATADNLNTWLYQDFGIRFNKDVVIDKTQAFQSPLVPVSTSLDSSSFITTNGLGSAQAALVFEAPNSIDVAPKPPANVTVSTLAFSTAFAYSKTDLQALLDNKIDQVTGDSNGPFVLAASAENTATHARVVLLSSTALGSDQYANFSNIDNINIAFNSLIWTTAFDDYFTQNVVPQQQTAQARVQDLVQQTRTQADATATPTPQALTPTATPS